MSGKIFKNTFKKPFLPAICRQFVPINFYFKINNIIDNVNNIFYYISYILSIKIKTIVILYFIFIGYTFYI